jgi:hypothetical protein
MQRSYRERHARLQKWCVMLVLTTTRRRQLAVYEREDLALYALALALNVRERHGIHLRLSVLTRPRIA